MEVKANFEVYGGAAKNERHKVTEPNQALQRMNVLVTDRAPSSTLLAIAVLKRSVKSDSLIGRSLYYMRRGDEPTTIIRQLTSVQRQVFLCQ